MSIEVIMIVVAIVTFVIGVVAGRMSSRTQDSVSAGDLYVFESPDGGNPNLYLDLHAEPKELQDGTQALFDVRVVE